jgi:hypothetical protein
MRLLALVSLTDLIKKNEFTRKIKNVYICGTSFSGLILFEKKCSKRGDFLSILNKKVKTPCSITLFKIINNKNTQSIHLVLKKKDPIAELPINKILDQEFDYLIFTFRTKSY